MQRTHSDNHPRKTDLTRRIQFRNNLSPGEQQQEHLSICSTVFGEVANWRPEKYESELFPNFRQAIENFHSVNLFASFCPALSVRVGGKYA
jgi:hypothetical protein